MNQTSFLLLGVLGLAGIGSLLSGNGEDHPPDEPGSSFGDGDVVEGTNAAATGSSAAKDAILSHDGGDEVEGGNGADLYVLRSDASGPADLYGGADRIQIAVPQDYDGTRDYQLLQEGDHVRLILDGRDLAVLHNVQVKDVREVTFITQSDASLSAWPLGPTGPKGSQ